ncbi:alginate export family protein [Cellvibrio japonicus]|uniref:Alginate export domain-containing protein n=1 Tax=Cellvibrio japonicus (strain Ueda107) TaxID=498211 RepID=B3PDN8_CELJU|nr:alginate export family protein [Cellvibrio japonicus]ACE84758.1 hypothetical protein CJA_1498 [Cellvibrio japonicus Ueda107]QEI12047.1 hypothetical protein FY117_07290 [Cellvibrio japonicus]QEI15621.1 hypothetical protein FY116_07295 [Cellvibrio japonicus]QEI19199.1 hypothetical protein FY115_07290 [Cellvibrio japonicus]
MNKQRIHFCAAAMSTIYFAVPQVSAQTFTESLQQGSSVKVNLRTRFEDVSEDGLQDSDALTARTRLSYQSGTWNGFGFSAEFDDVTELDGKVDYRAYPGDPQNPGTAVIGDPEGTEVNQAFIAYTNASNQVRYGRQRIILDNSRFIGNVGWRQNEQTYDGFSVVNKSIVDTSITYAYIWNVNRVFGDNNPIQPDHHMDSHIVNIGYSGFSAGKLTGYAYLLDNDTAPALSGDTVGIRWQGILNKTFSYNLEYARQTNAGVAESFDADYMLGEAVFTLSGFNITLGYELLGSDDGSYGFATPLATLHAFQGWADKFLATPAVGLEDKYINVGTTVAGIQFLLSYHKFDADIGSQDLGDEIDLSASRKFGSVVLTAKYADYAMGDVAAFRDTTKFWLMLDWNF